MNIALYLNKPILKIWGLNITQELKEFHQWKLYFDPESLLKGLHLFKNMTIVLIDVDNNFSLDYLQQIKKINPAIKLIAVGTPQKIEKVLSLLKSGFLSFLDISSNAVELFNCINSCRNEKYYLPLHNLQDLLHYQLEQLNSPVEIKKVSIVHSPGEQGSIFSTSPSLTEKETTVYDFLLKGYSYKEIANVIGITNCAVNQRIKCIYKKMNVRSRSELSYLAYN